MKNNRHSSSNTKLQLKNLNPDIEIETRLVKIKNTDIMYLSVLIPNTQYLARCWHVIIKVIRNYMWRVLPNAPSPDCDAPLL